MTLARGGGARHTRTHTHTQATHSLAINRHKDHGKLCQTLGLHLKEILALIRVALLEQDLVGANLVRRLVTRSAPLRLQKDSEPHRTQPLPQPAPVSAALPCRPGRRPPAPPFQRRSLLPAPARWRRRRSCTLRRPENEGGASCEKWWWRWRRHQRANHLSTTVPLLPFCCSLGTRPWRGEERGARPSVKQTMPCRPHLVSLGRVKR